MRSCNEPREIATASTVMRVAKALLSEINAEDNIPYSDEFVKDFAELEKDGVLTSQDDLRNRLVKRSSLRTTFHERPAEPSARRA